MTVMDLSERQVSYWVDSDKIRRQPPGSARRYGRRALSVKPARLPASYCSRPAPIVIFIAPASRIWCRPESRAAAVARAGRPDARHRAAGTDASQGEHLAVTRRWRRLAACPSLEHTYELNVKGRFIRTDVRTMLTRLAHGAWAARTPAGPSF